jgi:hypothetical protein
MEPSTERFEQRPRERVRGALQGLFDVLKEHGGGLTDEDVDFLSRDFTGEVDDYIEDLFRRMKSARKGRRKG